MDDYHLGKLLWLLLEPPHVLIILLAFGLLLCAWTTGLLEVFGRFLAGLCAGVLLLFVFLPIGDWLVRPLENRFALPGNLQTIHGVIVLSGGENEVLTADRGKPTIRFASDRLLTFMTVAHKYPDAILLYAGGNGQVHAEGKRPMAQAHVAAQIFKNIGFTRKVFYETESRTTMENAIATSKLVSDTDRAQPWFLITSAYHLPRAVASFRAKGWNVIPYPSDYLTTKEPKSFFRMAFMTNMGLAHAALHEYLGLAAYYFKGWTDTLWPKL